MNNCQSKNLGPIAIQHAPVICPVQAWLTTVVFSLLCCIRLLAGIPEPDTVFYGKIINRTSGQELLLSEGTLKWVITTPKGKPLTLETKLGALNGGEFSYRLNVPHQAVSFDADVSPTVVPLPPQKTTLSFAQILVNGEAAKIIAPKVQSIDVFQAARAATYRVDLEVSNPLADSDGNGLPDWWEKKFGRHLPDEDFDGDGWSNLEEFRTGTDPNADNRSPQLSTKEILVYADGTTAVRLRALDSDSKPADLTYVLTALPEAGTLYIRNASSGNASKDLALGLNASFTQADVNEGRIVFVHKDADANHTTTSFAVSLKDEQASHPPFQATVTVNVYRPGPRFSEVVLKSALSALPGRLPDLADLSSDEQQLIANYLLSKQLAYIIADASREAGEQVLAAPSSALSQLQYQQQYLPAYGSDRPYVFIGGPTSDTLVGGMENDVLIGGGGDDHLRGNAGSDLFVFTGTNDGNDTIEDFNVSENDTIDLSRVLAGKSGNIADFLHLSVSGDKTVMSINASGEDSHTDMVLTLSGVRFQQSDLVPLIRAGRFIVGDNWLPASVNIVAALPVASENGPKSGAFKITRTGSTDAELTVNLRVAGSASNGIDYAYLPSQGTIPAGESSLMMEVKPYVDTVTELDEIVEVTLVSGNGYMLGDAASARVTIEDLMPQISLETLEPLATKDAHSPALLLVKRAGVLDRSVFVRLNIAGTAGNFSDYEGVPAFINLPAGQTSELIQIVPKATAELASGTKSIRISIKEDPAYKLGDTSVANLLLIEHKLTFGQWRTTHFPEATGDLAQFAAGDLGGYGVPNLVRYAYGLDDRNPRNPENTSRLPHVMMSDHRLAVVFKRPAGVTDVQYLVEVSDDLTAWRSGPENVEQFTPPEHADDVETICYRVKSASDSHKLFMRVRVAYMP